MSSNEHSIKDLIRSIIDKYHISENMDQASLRSDWEKIMGKLIARHTKSISMRGSKLFLTIDSASLKNEIFISKDKLIERVNEYLGRDVINSVVIR